MEAEKLPKVEIESKQERIKKELEGEWERKSPKFRKFLAEQVFLPPEKWDKEFKEYVEKEYKIWQEDVPEKSREGRKEMTFKRYLKELDLNKYGLKNKKILDLGCGEKGDFVKFCTEKGITADIYGLDLKINPNNLDKKYWEQKYGKHFFKGDFDKEIPGENHDLIISVGAMSTNPNPSEKEISSVLKALKEDGEIRLAPILNAPTGRGLKPVDDSRKKWQGVMKSLAEKGEVEYQFQPTDIEVVGVNKDIILKEVLIIKKKK